MKIQQEPDSDLVQRVRAGDHDALAVLYTRYKDRIYAYCLHLSLNPTAAEDAVQETFLRMVEAIDTLADSQVFRAWLFRIAHNLVHNSLRRTSPGRMTGECDFIESDDPLQTLIREEEHRNLTSVLGRLKGAYRELLFLREYEGLSYAEIATTLEISVESVKIRIYRARKALAQRYKDEFKEGRTW